MNKLEFVAATAYVYRTLAAEGREFPVHMAIKRGVDEELSNALLAAQVCVALGGDAGYYAAEARFAAVEPADAELVAEAKNADISAFKKLLHKALSFKDSPEFKKVAELTNEIRVARRSGDKDLVAKLREEQKAAQEVAKAANPRIKFDAEYGSYIRDLFIEGVEQARL